MPPKRKKQKTGDYADVTAQAAQILTKLDPVGLRAVRRNIRAATSRC